MSLKFEYHALVPIPLDLSTREGLFVFSGMDPEDAMVFPSSSTVPSTSIPLKHSRIVVRSSFLSRSIL